MLIDHLEIAALTLGCRFKQASPANGKLPIGNPHDRIPTGTAMASTTLTPKRALRKPWRPDPRAVFGLFLMLVSVAGSVAFWTASTDTRAVLVVTRDRPAGATLGSSDVAVAN